MPDYLLPFGSYARLLDAARIPDSRLRVTEISSQTQIRWYRGDVFGGVICTVPASRGRDAEGECERALKELRGSMCR